MDVDLSKFDIDAAAVHPYLLISPKKNLYIVYEGAFGKRYQYFEIPANSEAGQMCKDYYEKYVIRNERRYN